MSAAHPFLGCDSWGIFVVVWTLPAMAAVQALRWFARHCKAAS